LRGAVEIVPASLRDLTYVAGNLRDIDRREIYCQLPRENPNDVALLSVRTSPEFRFSAQVGGQPVFCFGCGADRPGLWTAWAFGTRHYRRAIPAVTRFIKSVLVPSLIESTDAQRVQAFTLADHEQAHRWMESWYGTKLCRLRSYGKNGEDFFLYEWVREDLKHVLITSKSASTATAGSDASTDAGRNRSEG